MRAFLLCLFVPHPYSNEMINLTVSDQTLKVGGNPLKRIKKSGLLVVLLTLAFSFLTPTSPAQAAGFFQIVNKDTGKCLEWNGIDKTITQEKCKEKPDQWWNNMSSKLCNYGSPRSDWCLGATGKEKPWLASTSLTLNHCSSAA